MTMCLLPFYSLSLCVRWATELPQQFTWSHEERLNKFESVSWENKWIGGDNTVSLWLLCTGVQRKLPAQKGTAAQPPRSWEDAMAWETSNVRAGFILPVNDFELCEAVVEQGKPENSYVESPNLLLKFCFSFFLFNFIITNSIRASVAKS